MSDFVTRMRSRKRMLYAMQEGPDGPIKFGVSFDPLVRLRGIQGENIHDVRLIGAVIETKEVNEKQVLSHLGEEDRIFGEWFRPTEVVQKAAAWIAEHSVIPEKPFWEERTSDD